MAFLLNYIWQLAVEICSFTVSSHLIHSLNYDELVFFDLALLLIHPLPHHSVAFLLQLDRTYIHA
jgi:hypothetical protein